MRNRFFHQWWTILWEGTYDFFSKIWAWTQRPVNGTKKSIREIFVVLIYITLGIGIIMGLIWFLVIYPISLIGIGAIALVTFFAWLFKEDSPEDIKKKKAEDKRIDEMIQGVMKRREYLAAAQEADRYMPGSALSPRPRPRKTSVLKSNQLLP